MDNWLLWLIIAYIYIHLVTRNQTSPENGEAFAQEKEILQEIKNIISMYDGTMGMIPPDTKEEQCFPLNGHIGAVINRAIRFCG